MKQLLLFFATLFCVQARCQTLTASFHEPKPGDIQNSIVLDTAGFTSGMPLNITGAGLSWDFSKLKADTFAFTTTYNLPSSSTFSVDFPTATMVQKEGGDFQVFIRSTSTPTTQTEVLGIRSTSLSTTFTNAAIAAVFPISLGSTLTDNIAGTFTFAAFSGNCTGKITSNADATGTLTLPDGIVYTQVIRVKTVQTLTASAGFFAGTLRQTNYDFYDMSEKFPILGVSYSSFGLAFGQPTVTAGVNGNNKSFLAGISENSLLPHVLVYPSPAKDQVFFSCASCAETTTYEIIDGLGKKVTDARIITGMTTAVDVSRFGPGVYNIVFRRAGSQVSRKILIR